MEDRRIERRRMRQRQNRRTLARISLFFIGLLVGLVGSLYYAWIISPAQSAASSPAVLREPFRSEYILMISQAYAADNDWSTAADRLAALEDPDLDSRVAELLDQSIRAGQDPQLIRDLASVADQLGIEGRAVDLFVPTTAATAVAAVTADQTAAAGPTATATLLPTPTASPPPTVTPRPSATAVPLPTETATPIPDYRLLNQEQVCQTNVDRPLIAVTVVDALLEELPGVEVVVSWETGEDRFFTGFKPQEGAGYADFEMAEEISYSVTLVGGGEPVSGLRAGRCDDDEPQGWELRFQNLTVRQDATPTPDGTEEAEELEDEEGDEDESEEN